MLVWVSRVQVKHYSNTSLVGVWIKSVRFCEVNMRHFYKVDYASDYKDLAFKL
jgi:hypothetical protein